MAGLYALMTACGSPTAPTAWAQITDRAAGFGRRAARSSTAGASKRPPGSDSKAQAEGSVRAVRELLQRGSGSESLAGIRREMMTSLEAGAGIYRDAAGLEATCQTISALQGRYEHIEVHDKSNVFNTDLQQALELKNMLDVAETVSASALARKESRGAHQRLDFPERDDDSYLRHSLATRQPGGRPEIGWLDVTITRSKPGVRDYSGAKPA
jgi:fumarate reductase flavoprotein subunit